MKALALCLSFLVLAGCQRKPSETATTAAVAVPVKGDDLSALLRKADALIPEVDESEKIPPPAAEVFADATATPERIDRAERNAPVSSSVPVRATTRATSAPKSSTEPKSSMDTMRAEAVREFVPTLQRLSTLRDKFETDYRNYQSGCSGPVSFVQPVPAGGMSLDAIIAGGDEGLIPTGRIPPGGKTDDPSKADPGRTPLCRSLLQNIRLQRLQIRSNVNSMRETARRRDVWPGIMREIFEKYGLHVLSGGRPLARLRAGISRFPTGR